MSNAISARAAIRLSPSDLSTIETITAALQHPHRPPPGISDIIREALRTLAAAVSTGLPR